MTVHISKTGLAVLQVSSWKASVEIRDQVRNWSMVQMQGGGG